MEDGQANEKSIFWKLNQMKKFICAVRDCVYCVCNVLQLRIPLGF